MLQINSGKLYARGVGRRNALTGVLFTNARFSLDKSLETLAGALRSTGYGPQDRACVFDMEERIEAEEENRPGILISHTIDPFLNDFAVVATFGLGAVFSRDAQTARGLTGGEAGFSSYRPASEFIARHFDPTVFVSEEEAADFKVFVGDLLGLERKTFLAVMRAMRTFVAGLHADGVGGGGAGSGLRWPHLGLVGRRRTQARPNRRGVGRPRAAGPRHRARSGAQGRARRIIPTALSMNLHWPIGGARWIGCVLAQP